MGTINTEITINATASKVWQCLLDFNSYSNWNPFMQSISGDAGVGNILTITITPPNTKAMTFKPKIIKLEQNQELVWRGKLLMPGIFDGTHSFKLVRIDQDTTKLIHGETFSGILGKAIFNKIAKNTELGFRQMNIALKQLAEA